MEAISWIFRLLYILFGLLACSAGVFLLLGRKVPGIQQRGASEAPAGTAKIVGNTKVLGAVWVFIGMLGLFFGVMTAVGR